MAGYVLDGKPHIYIWSEVWCVKRTYVNGKRRRTFYGHGMTIMQAWHDRFGYI